MNHAFSVKYSPEAARFLLSFPPLPTEKVTLRQALGRTLAQLYTAPEDFPPYNRALRDGYAVAAFCTRDAASTCPVTVPITYECRSGDSSPPPLPMGNAARIWTGCMLPPGADCVVPEESLTLRQSESALSFLTPASRYSGVLPLGSDIARGTTLLSSGHVVREQDIALLAAFGITEVTVRLTPKVTVISSGNEIVPSAMTPLAGQARDSNAYAFSALCQTCGAQTDYLGIVRDDPAALAAQVGIALSDGADVVLISGGSSSGKLDITLQALRSVPGCAIVEHSVPMTSGKPFAMAHAKCGSGKRKSAIWGLPGHVLGALMCAELFVRPLLFRLQGGNQHELPDPYKAILTEAAMSRTGQRDYFCLADCGQAFHPVGQTCIMPVVRPVPAHSGLLSAMFSVSGVARCAEQLPGLQEGEEVDVYPFAALPFLHDAMRDM